METITTLFQYLNFRTRQIHFTTTASYWPIWAHQSKGICGTNRFSVIQPHRPQTVCATDSPAVSPPPPPPKNIWLQNCMSQQRPSQKSYIRLLFCSSWTPYTVNSSHTERDYEENSTFWKFHLMTVQSPRDLSRRHWWGMYPDNGQ